MGVVFLWQNAVELLDKDPNFFLSFTLIITSNIDPSVEDRIAQLLWQSESDQTR